MAKQLSKRKAPQQPVAAMQAESATPGPEATVVDVEVAEARLDSPKAKPGQYLTFFLSGEEYAAGILKVREILEYRVLTRVPMTPPWVRGVLNLRGGVVPVVDMAVKFGLPETEITPLTCVVIVEIEFEGETSVLGLMIDAVSRVIDLTADQIEPAPVFGTRVHTQYLLGLGTLGETLLLILNIDRLLASDELMEVSAIDQSPGADLLGGGDPSVPDAAQTQPAAPAG